MLRITLVLFIVGGAVAQIKLPKSCPNFKTVKNFDVQRYMGKWYQDSNYTVKSSIEDKCVTATHSSYKNGSFKITYTQTPLKRGDTHSYEYTAVPISNPRNGKFKLTPGGAPYWVLATDYTSWTLVSSCTNSISESILSAWIYTRARNPSKLVIRKAYAAVIANDINDAYFIGTKKKGCPKSY